jgi:hypothetical protein
MLQKLPFLVVVTIALALLVGCGDRVAEAPQQTAMAVSSAHDPPMTPLTDGGLPGAIAPEDLPTDADMDGASKPSEEIEGETAAADDRKSYSPPFPDRIDLFVAPKRQGGAAAPGSADSTVELMGFVRVDRMRAVLLINGQVTSMAEGDAQDGIEVVSIQPPNVVLQRGRQRWQATLQ